MSPAEVPHGAVVVAVDGGRPAAAARAWATAAATKERRPLVVTRSRLPARALDSLSARAHLLVIDAGRHGTRAVVVRRSRCPVVVVPDRPAPGRGVVVGVGGDPGSVATLDFAFRTASWLGESLTVVHCYQEAEQMSGHALVSPPHSDLAGERLLVAETLAGLRTGYPEVAVGVRIERGLPEDVLGDLGNDAVLVVVGGTRHGLLTERTIGSVARRLLVRGACPVAVVPHSRREQPTASGG
ncbi:universal stress protein [Nocardioides sp. L-11A]|uniref:universal stress protein n=1 Tax=Nocardioides sp. L-11A TaxID=3043848 RepID=UPI00249B95E6|nr:universal stress protein [Nocardioides sp. L-11A]